MTYRLQLTETIPAGIQRIGREQLIEAIQRLTSPEGDRDKNIHSAARN